MKSLVKFKNNKCFLIVLATIYWACTFLWERQTIDLSGLPNRLLTYVTVKIILYFFILIIVYYLSHLQNHTSYRMILLYSLPYIVFTLIKCVQDEIYPFISDDAYIYDAVIHFTDPEYTSCTFNYITGMFTYFTTYFCLISLMLIPGLHGISIILLKVILCGLIVGYCVYRINKYYHCLWGMLVYGMFFVSPSSELGVTIQRMPMYGMLYFLFITILFFDWKEKVPFTRKKTIFYCIIIPVLTQWRVEGIYLLVIGPILVLCAYHTNTAFNKQFLKRMLVCYLLSQIVIYIPQGYETVINTSNYSAYRISHFYNYVLTNMMRYGLADVADPDDLKEVDRYISLDAVNILNAELGDESFKDEYIASKDGYIGVRSNASFDDLTAYESAMKRIILKHPFLYIRVQLKAFKSVTTHYGVAHIKTACTTLLFGNIILSVFLIFIFWIWSLFNKNYFICSLSTGLLCHTAITTLLLPAAYFKYYYAQYICAGFLVIITAIAYIDRFNHLHKQV